jgi:hypothetical protein
MTHCNKFVLLDCSSVPAASSASLISGGPGSAPVQSPDPSRPTSGESASQLGLVSGSGDAGHSSNASPDHSADQSRASAQGGFPYGCVSFT